MPDVLEDTEIAGPRSVKGSSLNMTREACSDAIKAGKFPSPISHAEDLGGVGRSPQITEDALTLDIRLESERS